ncbi:hypothetical protein FSP39_021819 [Pinctada imbricata]|uniref:RING-type domain-containing protein n=1 Tax=Pinctada imbricata TaxID=66713 RepID=A0AA89C488_PINIB|nr:hypothetical protein FSP39_021819 [Pinctada imbricata]
MLGVISQPSSKMPANFYEMSANQNLQEEQRALQLAFELSVLGLGGEDDAPTLASSTMDSENRKKGANTTECVPVPSSEHVAEIVGRQGCKIKALRAKTNTYIKTPVRGEEPVFVVTGRKEDVNAAKREILSAAEHFSQIRASRRNSSVSSTSSVTNGILTTGPPSPNTPGQVTIQVRVPYRVVGLVVGPKGATIKRIQQQTHTYIVTPSRDKEPVFEVTGLPESVEKARLEIESHIALRTGGMLDQQNEDDFHSNGVDSGFHELNSVADIFGLNKCSGVNGLNAYNNLQNMQNGNGLPSNDNNIFNFPVNSKMCDFPVGNGFTGFSSFGIYDNDEGIGGSPSFDPLIPPPSIWPEFGGENRNLVSSVFGSTSTTNGGLPSRSQSVGNSSSPRQLSPSLPDSPSSRTNGSTGSSPSSPPLDHQAVRRIRSDPLASSAFVSVNNPNFTTTTTSIGINSSATTTNVSDVLNGVVTCPMQVPTINGRPRRQCLMCSESDIVAALVPCGHNLFCMECANLIVEKSPVDRICPVCEQPISQAIRIFS